MIRIFSHFFRQFTSKIIRKTWDNLHWIPALINQFEIFFREDFTISNVRIVPKFISVDGLQGREHEIVVLTVCSVSIKDMTKRTRPSPSVTEPDIICFRSALFSLLTPYVGFITVEISWDEEHSYSPVRTWDVVSEWGNNWRGGQMLFERSMK